MNNQIKKGFTLIELLVVIAIIGLLSTVIAVGATQVKNSARDSMIKENLAGLRKLAQMIIVESGNLTRPDNSFCDNGHTLNNDNTKHPEIAEIESDLEKHNGGEPILCYAIDDSFCVASSLNLETGFCVDSTGQATSQKVNCDETLVCH